MKESQPASNKRYADLEQRLRSESPLIADESVDCVVSNCVLNLVREADRAQLLQEVFRVLKRGGKAVISDIVCDEDVPQEMRDDPTLWSGCISGAFREDAFLAAFEAAGFHGMEILKREEEPWQTVNGIEFRSVTVSAYKGKQGPCLERNQALIYRGPFKKVEDDDGHLYFRGQRIAVCDKTFNLLQQAPYAGQFLPVEPYQDIPLEQATEMDCRRNAIRDPRETKGKGFDLTDLRDQLEQMLNMGGLGAMLDKLPLPGNVNPAALKNEANDKQVRRQIAIINSMTPAERRFPKTINGSRKKRIASGAGLQIQDVNRLLKQHMQMEKMMKKVSKGGMPKGCKWRINAVSSSRKLSVGPD